jgi:uncharacterized protein Veg
MPFAGGRGLKESIRKSEGLRVAVTLRLGVRKNPSVSGILLERELNS